ELRSAPKIIGKPIAVISVLSYSMYLLHYSIILQLMHFYYDFTNSTVSDYIVFTLIYLLLTLIASYILYRFYEKPLTDLRETAGTANLERFFPLSRFYRRT